MAIDLTTFTRSRCVGWNSKDKKGIYSDDLIDDAGKVREAEARALGIDPAAVRPITVNDLPVEYTQGARAALTKLAAEWSQDADEIVYELVLKARLQDEANASVKEHRPVTDKAADRARSTMVKLVMAQHGVSEEQAAQMLDAILKAKPA